MTTTDTPRAKTAKALAERAEQLRFLRPGHDQIAHRAYQIWEADGRPIGREEKHWLQAERELIRHADSER